MISSEVQRTLVKSPPELWAELSDPEALARHLGELGEIRITRTEPEQLVEWEADGTSGSVALKASGWGTRVTLSVARELPPPAGGDDPPAAEAEPASSASEPTPSGLTAAERFAPDFPPSLRGERLQAPPQEPEPAPAPRPEPISGPSPEPTLVTASAPEPEPISSYEPEPVTAAAREPLRVTSGAASISTAPRAEPELELDEGTPGVPGEGTAPSAGPAPEPNVRSGFFARIFGRGKRAGEPPAHIPEPPLPAARAADARPPIPIPQPAISSVGRVPSPAIALAAPWEPATTPVGDRPGPEHEHAVVSAGGTDPIHAPQATEATDPPPGREGIETEQPEPAEYAPSGGDQGAASGPSEPEPADLAAELRAAEEATEEVTAVLTAVLDRLGAAHHRPFSRS